jgi:chorismate-pyruvate lyase
MTPLQGKVADLMRPLAEFYAMNGQTVPNVEAIDGESMPQPYRQLLVHSNDMTPTLEDYWQQPIHLRPLSVHREGDLLTRQVVLVASESHRPVEFGAIRIHLQRYPEPVQKLIIEGHTPLGAILREHRVEHRSRPSGFFQIASDAVTQTSFDLHGDHMLYGRHNLLLNFADEPMAEVVEILPPVETDNGKASA